MGAIQLRNEWGRQPQYPVEVDWSNPKLKNCHAIFSGTHLYTRKGIMPATVQGYSRLGAYGSATSAYIPELDVADTSCLVCVTRPTHGAGYQAYFQWGYYVSISDNQLNQFSEWGSASPNCALNFRNNGADTVGATYTDTYPIREQIYRAYWNNTTATAEVRKNGVVQRSGGRNGGAQTSEGRKQVVFYSCNWGFAFSNATDAATYEADLTRNPWQIFKDEILIVPFAGSSGAADLTGAAVVNPAASAAISLSVPMVAAGVVVATTNGAMSLSLPMTGNASGQASTAGGVSLSVPLAASALIQALAAAGLSQSNPLGSSAAVAASSTGNMTLNVSMAGAALIEALAAANLTVTGDGMSGAALVQPSAAGNMSLGLPLATSSLVVSNTSGSLTQIVPMSGAAASASLATGGLNIAVNLNTAALIEALAAASLSVDGSMGGAGAGDAQALGTLTLRVNMSTSAVIQAMAAGGLAGNGQLVGTTGYRVTRAPRSWQVTRKPRNWRVSA